MDLSGVLQSLPGADEAERRSRRQEDDLQERPGEAGRGKEQVSEVGM